MSSCSFDSSFKLTQALPEMSSAGLTFLDRAKHCIKHVLRVSRRLGRSGHRAEADSQDGVTASTPSLMVSCGYTFHSSRCHCSGLVVIDNTALSRGAVPKLGLLKIRESVYRGRLGGEDGS